MTNPEPAANKPDATPEAIAEENRKLREAVFAQERDSIHRIVADAEFWFRRFITVVSIANTAAVVAITSAFANAEQSHMEFLARTMVGPLTLFTIGMCLAGSAPLLLFLSSSGERAAYWYRASTRLGVEPTSSLGHTMHLLFGFAGFVAAAASICFFLLAIMKTIGTMRGLVAA